MKSWLSLVKARTKSGRRALPVILFCLGLLVPPTRVPAAETNVIALAAASDLVFCLEELNAQFTQSHPGTVCRVTTGSSGNFFAQIQRGAPFDVFLSADISYPRKLAEAGHAEAASLTSYAIGRIVLWTVKTNLPVELGLGVLTRPEVRRVALANPEHAPYGQAARAALQKANLWTPLQPKLVLGDNIAQTAQFVESGHVEAGLVALSLVSAPKLKGTGTWWLVPEEFHPRLEQAAILTRRGTNNPAARAYLQFLRSPSARAVLDHFGFQPPPR
jgi:molybdate transport system substrate-binding protein